MQVGTGRCYSELENTYRSKARYPTEAGLTHKPGAHEPIRASYDRTHQAYAVGYKSDCTSAVGMNEPFNFLLRNY